jgi:hypothetical protein
MTLKDDLNRALGELTRARETPVSLDEQGWTQLVLPVPPGITKLSSQQLIIEVVLSKTGNYFTLLTPLAVLDGRPSAEFFQALLYRQFSADQVEGAGFGLSAGGERDRLVALCHWPLPAITPDQFSALFRNFVKAALALVREVKEMARREPALILIYPD